MKFLWLKSLTDLTSEKNNSLCKKKNRVAPPSLNISKFPNNFYFNCREVRLSIVENIHWTKFEKHGLLEKITISQLREFADQFLTEMKILSVMQGNIMKEDAVAVMKNVLNNIPCHKVNDVSILEPSCLHRANS